MLNSAVPGGLDAWQAVAQDLLYDSFWQSLKNVKIELRSECQTLKRTLTKTLNLLRKEGIPERNIPKELLSLKTGLDEVIQWSASRPRGRPRSREDTGFALRLARCCQIALIDSGFRRNPSMMSDKGPASFVIAKCLNKINGTDISAATVARHIRKQNAFYWEPIN
jgi:hypothetical protein